MKKTIPLFCLGLFLLMAGIALGRWSLLRQGVVLQSGNGTAVVAVSLNLSPATDHGEVLSRTININTATAEELTELPGIGQTIAQRIVAYRLEYGNFQTVEELKGVRGIGDGIFAKLVAYISVK